MDFYERQSRNRRVSILLVVAVTLLFAAVGGALDASVFGFGTLGGAPVPLATAGALLLSTGMSAASYFRGDRFVLSSLLARPLDPGNPEHRQFHNIATEMALAAGLPMPSLYVIPDPAPNALATGRDPGHASIAVTEGALILLDREETEGVIAHEMSHIANRDTLVMMLVSVLLGGIVLLADWGRRSVTIGSSERRGADPFALVALLLVVLSPLLSRLLAMAVSREREYLADASAAQMTRNPEGLARALEKIAGVKSPLAAASRGTAHMFLSDPLGRRLGGRDGFLARLLTTHPPIENRIAVLRGLVR